MEKQLLDKTQVTFVQAPSGSCYQNGSYPLSNQEHK